MLLWWLRLRVQGLGPREIVFHIVFNAVLGFSRVGCLGNDFFAFCCMALQGCLADVLAKFVAEFVIEFS